MAPRKLAVNGEDLFRSRLEAMIDMDHALVKLGTPNNPGMFPPKMIHCA